MVREKHQVTKDIISVTKTFANSDEGRQRHPHITDDNSRAYTSLSLYQSKYKSLVRKFPELEENYNIKKIRNQYNKYYNTALDHFKELAIESDTSFVPPPTPAPRRRKARAAPTTAPATSNAVSSTTAPASSAEVILLAQSVNTLGKTFADRDLQMRTEQAERDAKKAEEDKENRKEMLQIRKDMAERDEKKDEEILQIRKDMADRDEKRAEADAKRAEEDKENRDVMMKAINANTEMNKSTRNMAALALEEVGTAKKDIQAIRQFVGMDDQDVPNANLFQDDDSVVAADDREVPFEENLEVENATATFDIEENEQPGTPSKNDVAEVPIEENLEENIEVENDAATFEMEDDTGTPNDDLDVPAEENIEVENDAATFEMEGVEQPGTPSKNDVVDDLEIPIEENREVENATATEQPATPSKNDVAPENSSLKMTSPKKTSTKKTIFWTVTAVGIFIGISAVIFASIFSDSLPTQEDIFSAAKYNLSLVLEKVQQLKGEVALPDAVAVKEAVLNCFLALVLATLLA